MLGKPTLLLLAGTQEAREIAEALATNKRWRVIASLAGATQAPAELPSDMRRGGFGGVDGMVEALQWDNVRAVIDATHPFAEQISANAAAACAELGLPRVLVRRPEWAPEAGDDWRKQPDLAAAADALPLFARAFLATGRQSLTHFKHRKDVWFLARAIDAQPGKFPLPRGDYTIGKPPFPVGHEVTLMRDYRITHLVAKNSGGAVGIAKFRAARELGLPVLMVERPAPPRGAIVETATEALDWAASLAIS